MVTRDVQTTNPTARRKGPTWLHQRRCFTKTQHSQIDLNHDKSVAHRIRGAGIYANIGSILMGSMLPYMSAPWILWVGECRIIDECREDDGIIVMRISDKARNFGSPVASFIPNVGNKKGHKQVIPCYTTWGGFPPIKLGWFWGSLLIGIATLPSGYVKIAIENGHL